MTDISNLFVVCMGSRDNQNNILPCYSIKEKGEYQPPIPKVYYDKIIKEALEAGKQISHGCCPYCYEKKRIK